MMAYFVPAAHQLDLLVFVIGIAFVGKIANIIYCLQLKLKLQLCNVCSSNMCNLVLPALV